MRELIRQRDSDGLTFLMHAANSKETDPPPVNSDEHNHLSGDERNTPSEQADDGPPALQGLKRSQTSGRNFADFANVVSFGIDMQSSLRSTGGSKAVGEQTEKVDRAVPVVKAAIAFLRETMWKEEVSASRRVTQHDDG